MYLCFRLTARSHWEWYGDYGYGIYGRFSEALTGTEYEQAFTTDDETPSYTFSGIRPYRGEVDPGDTAYLLVASPEPDLLRTLATHFRHNSRLSVGRMQWEVRAAEPWRPALVDPDAAPQDGDVPEGWLQSVSGISLRVASDEDGTHYWGESYAPDRVTEFETFREQLHRSIAADCQDEYVPVPDALSAGGELFERYEHVKTFGEPFTVTSGTTITAVRSHWRFKYALDDGDDAHREQLALACRHGVGSKTAYGCGMVVPVPTPTLDPGEAVVWAAGQAFDETPGVTTPDVNPSEVTAHVDV
jgi:CRISPR/Cas system endoribonuclease Cas6 (RAMP superfamily)